MPKKETQKKTKPPMAAVIDIGSNELRLKVAQGGKVIKTIESLSFPLSLGRDTFHNGKISFEKVEKACTTIKNFLTVVKQYGVTDIRAFATTAVREATNSNYILDQIKIKTGLDITVMDDMDEKSYIYKLLSAMLDDDVRQSSMMIYLGSGNIGISVTENNRMPFMQNVKIGALRISEIFGDMPEYTSEFYLILEEYLSSFTDMLDNDIPDAIGHFIVAGYFSALIAELCGAETKNDVRYIPKDRFLKLYDDIKHKTSEQISDEYDIPFERTELLLPVVCICHNLMGFTNAELIVSPDIMLSDAILYEMLRPDEFAKLSKEFYKNTVHSAQAIAKKYFAVEEHYKTVAKFALTIFDKMKKIHGMGAAEKLYLHTAAILHDIGKYINLKGHYYQSCNIIRGTDIVGLNGLQTKLVAAICLYHSRLLPSENDDIYRDLSTENKVLVSKLAAILRIADALDRSHMHKFDDIDVKITDDELMVTINTDDNIAVEMWSFNQKAAFFEEVFGLKAALRKKRGIGV